MDLCERDNARESCIIDTPQKNLAASDEKIEFDEFIASSTSYEDNGHILTDENEPEILTGTDPLIIRTSGLVVPSVGDKQFSESSSDGTTVDVISDDEGSWVSASDSPSATHSDVESEGYLEHRVSDNCYSACADTVDDNMAVIVFPDYVIYKNMLCGDSRLTFFTDCIKIECSDVSGNGKFVLECAIADIIYIHRQWSGSVEAALVKLCFKATDANGNEKPHNDGELKIIFAIADTHWFEKEQKIRNLAERYGDIWNALPNDDLVGGDDTLVPDMLFSRQCFTENYGFFAHKKNYGLLRIVEPFEDVIYPKGDPDAVSISKRDIELLQPETFVNDTIIDFYIKYLKNKIEPNEKHRFHFFNSFFFRKLADMDKDPGSASEGRAAFLRVRKWTRKVNIFEKDYIFIPVNFNLHWSLLVICHPGEAATLKDDDIKESSKVPCILHMDSIKGSHSGLKNIIQSYLWEEWKERHPEASEDNSSKFSNLRYVSLELPQQENSFDCGLFLLHFVELFLEEAPANFSPFKITKFSSFLGADWFSPVEAYLKRFIIWKLIYDLLKVPSQKVMPTTCTNGHFSGFPEIEADPVIEFLPVQCHPAKPAVGDSITPATDRGNENDVEQVRAVEFLPQPCSPAKPVLSYSCGPASDRVIQIELSNTSSDVTQCDKNVGLVVRELLGPGATAGFYPEVPENACQQDEPFEKLASTACRVEHVDKSLHFVSSSLDNDACQPPGGISNSQICSTSYSPEVVGVHDTLQSSMQEKEANVTSLESFNMDQTVSDWNHEAGEPESVSPKNKGYVPDSPSLSSEKQLDGFVEDSQKTDTVNVKNEDHQNSQVIDSMEDGGDGGDCKEVKKSEARVGDSITEAEDGDCDNCQKQDATRADGEEGQNNAVTEADGMDGDCENVVTTEAESGLCGGPCEENLPPMYCQDIVIADDESSLDDDDDEKLTAKRLEQQPCKRQKVMLPEGRRRTRSFTRDCP
ncbi:probable ubiquitin-like-specific protease 2B isoform X2 [Phoenix dactylifera]|uniref:Probable ubiquitin-like-specific protease 2B isoform X2 n=1 Tax=Phoenix dactylifera TaxID=42345 RepID=A0A8B8J9Z0_PHODC|nr:probable ubiquitin-like-specific protease 2B isoform X2 [Phoenix dactylifera]